MNLKRWDRKFAFIVIIVLAAAVLSAPLYIFARNYIQKNRVASEVVATEEVAPAAEQTPLEVVDTPATPVPAPAKEEIKKSPPKHSTPAAPVKTTENPDGTTTTQIAESSQNLPTDCKTTKTSSGGSTPTSVYFSDKTGKNAALEGLLKNYLNSTLKWGGEISKLYEIVVCNAGNSGWEGQYLGSYTATSGGTIISAYGYIVLNTYYHEDSPNFNDYMKLVLSHEYGHHYSLYHKWIDLQLPMGVRFPDAYYNIRPLSKSGTATDYSLGWANCEAEIVAEDYSYLYSGYGFQAMSATYGFPSAGTKTWFNGLASSSAPEPEAPAEPAPETPEPDPTPAPTTPVPDTENPTVTIVEPATNPYLWSNGNLTFRISGTDNIGVVKIKLYINNFPVGEAAASSATATWRHSDADPGSYEIKAEAYDAAGNIGTATITVIKS